jgi:hypothetical protein
MAKITFECDDPTEARAFLDLIEAASDGNGNVLVEEITHTPEARVDLAATGGAVDVHGMTWSEHVHASTKTQNADGSWKAKKGFAEQAKAAVAAHKAAGGNQPAPADLPATGMPAAGGMPAATPEVPPISQDMIEQKLMGMMQRGVLPDDMYGQLLDKHAINRQDPGAVLSTNESLRAALYASCCELEPEAPGA